MSSFDRQRCRELRGTLSTQGESSCRRTCINTGRVSAHLHVCPPDLPPPRAGRNRLLGSDLCRFGNPATGASKGKMHFIHPSSHAASGGGDPCLGRPRATSFQKAPSGVGAARPIWLPAHFRLRPAAPKHVLERLLVSPSPRSGCFSAAGSLR
jgi:hypothetical protein